MVTETIVAGSFKQSLFLSGVRLPAAYSECSARSPAHFQALQVVNAQKRQVNSGSKSEGTVLQSHKPSWDGTNALAVTEGFCIVVAAASYSTSVFRNKQSPLVTSSSSAGESKFLPKVGELSTWYVPALWAALVINAILRTVQRRSSTKSTQRVWEERSVKDFSLDKRVGQLEEDVQGVTTIAQTLSRHLEKLGVRFRVTRRTLRDPIQETVVLTQKASEVIRVLASREQALERELEKTQRALVAMQAQQEKQLELLVSGMTKTLNSQQASERRILKELSRRLGEETDSSKDIGSRVPILKEKGGTPPTNRKNHVMKDIGSLWKGFKKNLETSNSSSTTSLSHMKGSSREIVNGEAKEEYKENGHASVTPETNEGPSKESTYYPDSSFTEEDFWVTAIPRETSASFETVSSTDAELRHVSDPRSSTSSGRMDSFFSNKKKSYIPQQDTLFRERDFSDPGVDQLYSPSGEHNNSISTFS